MLSRLPVRTLLAAAVALVAGFIAAFFVLGLAADQIPAEPLIQIGAAYLTWVAVALAVYLLIRRFVPAVRHPANPTDGPDAPPGEARAPDRREAP